MAKYEEHSFYCINCGRKGIPILRNRSKLHTKNHRKKLYCPFCKAEVNHIEVRTSEEEEQFKEDFKKGVFKNEAETSLSYVRGSRIW